MGNLKVDSTADLLDRRGIVSETGLATYVVLVLSLALSACGKKDDADRGPGRASGERKAVGDSPMVHAAMDSLNPGSAASAEKSATSAGHAFDGFYIHRSYLGALKASRSIFKTPFPNGTVYLQIHGDSVVMDYSNHEGGNGRLLVDS
ncbi:MAG: hypothetical protein ABIW76_23400, partial [Fibrobacteria bacterium]